MYVSKYLFSPDLIFYASLIGNQFAGLILALRSGRPDRPIEREENYCDCVKGYWTSIYFYRILHIKKKLVHFIQRFEPQIKGFEEGAFRKWQRFELFEVR